MLLWVVCLGGMVETFQVRPVIEADRAWLPQFFTDHWGSSRQVVRGAIFFPHELSGFVAEMGDEVVGVITYRLLSQETAEIATLNSLQAGAGIGGALVDAVIGIARQQGCRLLVVVTTNDNLRALRFYQRHGFVLHALRTNALAASRQLKPEIPVTGFDGIPLRDEIELAMAL